MSKNKIQDPFLGPIKDMQRSQNEHHHNYYRGRHRITMFDNVINVLNLPGVSTSTWTDLDFTGYTSSGTGQISDDTFAVILQVRVKDSASATSDAFISYRKNGSTDTIGQLVAQPSHINNTYHFEQGIVYLDSNYICERAILASGANTLTSDIYLIGYIEQIS